MHRGRTHRGAHAACAASARPAAVARGGLACALSCALALSLLAGAGAAAWPGAAHADTTDIDAEADAAQQLVESTAQDYEDACARVEELEEQMAESEERIAEIEAQLPDKQQSAGEACRTLYQLQRNAGSLIDMILGIQSLDDLLRTVEYLNHIQQSSLGQIEELQSALDELEEQQTALEEAQTEASEQEQAAAEALAAAQEARAEVQQRAQELAAEEEAAAQAEAEEAAEEEAEEAEEEADEEEGDDESSESLSGASDDDADWSSDKATFVSEWGARIDAYLAGSALAGQGETFAEAAWNYGVDPRWSPAIACVESGLGANCAHSYNAWGWGSVSWSSWEEAIDAHVAGLARGYGYTLSVTAAQKYCPSNWESWYNKVSAQMSAI